MQINLAECLSKDSIAIVEEVLSISKKLNIKAYLVGGIIRDIVLNKSIIDIDITIDGDGILFARKFAQAVGGKIVIYEKFMTATVQTEKWSVDFVSTRKEIYTKPGALPNVSKGSLEDDIKRRDFSINSLAFLLADDLKGKIIDLLGGLEDLENGIVRVLHPLSFFEDPTRLFRGIRFAGRFDYKFDRKTKELLKEVISKKASKTISKERIANEFRYIFFENNVVKILFLMKKIGMFDEFSELIDFDDKTTKILRRFDKLAFKQTLKDSSIFLCGALLINTQSEYIKDAISLFGLNKNQKMEIEKLYKLKEAFTETDNNFENMSLYNIFTKLSHYSFDLLKVVVCTGEYKNGKKILRKLIKAQEQSQINISGIDLNNLGIAPGKIYSEIIELVREQTINGIVQTRNEQLDYISKLLLKK